jgi:predicted transposase/invertase (TIGR01784 family)
VLEGFGARQTEHWGQGIYCLPGSFRAAIVVLHQLPATLDTLWLRLLARGSVQTQAVAELLALSTSDAFRKVTLYHLAQLQLIMKTRTQKLSKDEQELVENLNPIYEAWERETINRGIEQGIERGIEQGREQMLSLTIPVLVDAGFTPQQIAQRLQIEVATVDRLLNQPR